MLRPTYSYAHSRSAGGYLEQDVLPGDQEGSYMPGVRADVFLFSPSLCSRSSQDSASQSSSSFDALSYICSPADRSASATIFSPSALPSTAPSRSPTFVDSHFSGCEDKPITRLSPSTPFQRLFDSSPGGYWQADDLSVSPISRHTGTMNDPQLGTEQDAEGENEDDDVPISGKIESLLAYKQSHEIPDSPRVVQRASSPSSLSSLSSRSSSPFIALPGLPFPSSQTSYGRMSPIPRSGQSGSRSLLGSPVKMASPSPIKSAVSRYLRRSTRLRPVKNGGRRPLVADLLNQPGLSNVVPHAARSPSPFSSPVPAYDSDDENYEPAAVPHFRTRKRVRRSTDRSPGARDKRQRTGAASSAIASSATVPTVDDDTAPTYPQRTFPLSLPIHGNFHLFYRRFPASSVVDADLAAAHNIRAPKVPDGVPNPPRDALDLYTPRFVKGRGTSKVGLCPICHESVERGGEGKKLWLSMKFSAFNYHMQYAHGISPATGRPFSPPVAFRVSDRPNAGKLEKTQIMEGKCHKCRKWVAVEGIKDVPTKVREIFWWKHAATCHQGSTMEGECDVFVEDAIYEAVASLEDAEGETDEDE
ncbi:hypothetical protein C8Q77DRAFT_1127766 [Trametes polyzona]|nr:hypothetical protein C8Q77DRAFT_1127766 [Trametes polyzona]